uniref:C-type lectin domain-containing protein n=1 Tax=Acrobeloides nanus TaxID=290746 RepID=A0A914CA21_9BILA
MFCSNGVFLLVGVVAGILVDSHANLFKIHTNKTIESFLNRHKRDIDDDYDGKTVYYCGNNEFSHAEGTSGKWEKKNITYFIESFGTSMSEEEVRKGIQNAFAHWADTVDLTFTEVNESTADIVLGFKHREHGDNFPFESIYSTKKFEIAHCTGNMPCTTIHFNDELQWEYVEWESAMKKGKWLDPGYLDFLTVAMHQIGHALGLGHVGDDRTRHAHADEESVNIMDKIYTRPAGKTDVYAWPRLRTGDAKGIKSLYQKVEDFEEMKQDCQGYWKKHEYATYNNLTGKYIVLQKGAENLVAAQDYCQKIGGFLVSIHSEEENKFITDFIRSKFSAGRYAYIGLVRANSSWIWEDGTVLTYQNWNPTEPNNVGGFENSVELVATEEHGGWNDIPNDRAKTAVCQVQCPLEVKKESNRFLANLLASLTLLHFLGLLFVISLILNVILVYILIRMRNSNKNRFSRLDNQKLLHA